MRHVLAIPLLALAAFLTSNLCAPTIARADEPSGYIFAGNCDDHGKMTSTTAFNVEDAHAAVPLEATIKHGVKLHEIVDGRPLASKEIGRVKFGAHVKVHELRILGADPGKMHAVWAKITVDEHYVLHADVTLRYLHPTFESYSLASSALRDEQGRHHLKC